MKGRLTGLHSVSINLKHRITLVLEIREEEILLIDVGTHDEVCWEVMRAGTESSPYHLPSRRESA